MFATLNTINTELVSRGPSSVNPVTGTRYGTNFPMISVKDMIEVQRLLLEHLGISKVSDVTVAYDKPYQKELRSWGW